MNNNPHYTELTSLELQEILDTQGSYVLAATLMLWDPKAFAQYCRTHKLRLPLARDTHSYLSRYTNQELVDLYKQHNSYGKLAEALGVPCTKASLVNEFRKREILGLHDRVLFGTQLGQSNKGRVQSAEEKQSRRLGVQNREGHREHMQKLLALHTGSKHSEATKQKMAVATVNRKPFKGESKLEKTFREALEVKKLAFTAQYPLPEVRSIADFFFAPNIAVYVDGCFVHACKEHHPELYDPLYRQGKRRLENAYDRSTANDPSVNQKLLDAGYQVLRFWEHDIVNDILGCISKIEQAIEDSKNDYRRKETQNQ